MLSSFQVSFPDFSLLLVPFANSIDLKNAGSSPTGVLSILLAGEEGAIGPRDFEGGSFGGRVRSVDGFWVPTSKVKTLFG